MISEIQKLLDEYIKWLRDNTALRQIKDYVEITTPYLDRHNDYLQIYVRRSNQGYVLTDDSYIIEDLRHSGCNLDSKKRKDLLNLTLNGFGVQLNEEALEVHASESNFGLQKHNLTQAMLAINDLFYLAEPTVLSIFLEDVSSWLDLCEIRYTPRVKFTGKSGYDHQFDFVVPKSKTKPERIIQTINRPSRQTVEAKAFAWIDTKDVRSPESLAYTFLNDANDGVSESVIEALKSYDIHAVLWSKRDSVRNELAA